MNVCIREYLDSSVIDEMPISDHDFVKEIRDSVSS